MLFEHDQPTDSISYRLSTRRSTTRIEARRTETPSTFADRFRSQSRSITTSSEQVSNRYSRLNLPEHGLVFVGDNQHVVRAMNAHAMAITNTQRRSMMSTCRSVKCVLEHSFCSLEPKSPREINAAYVHRSNLSTMFPIRCFV